MKQARKLPQTLRDSNSFTFGVDGPYHASKLQEQQNIFTLGSVQQSLLDLHGAPSLGTVIFIISSPCLYMRLCFQTLQGQSEELQEFTFCCSITKTHCPRGCSEFL